MDQEKPDQMPGAPAPGEPATQRAASTVPERPSVPTAEEAGQRWARGIERAAARPPAPKPKPTAYALLVKIAARLDLMEAQHVHMHADLVALREVERIPRPECYPSAPKPKRRAPRAKEE